MTGVTAGMTPPDLLQYNIELQAQLDIIAMVEHADYLELQLGSFLG
jgi:hypothetical protein